MSQEGKAPQSPRTAARMVGGRRRGAGRPSKTGVEKKTPVTTGIMLVDEPPVENTLETLPKAPPMAKKHPKYPPTKTRAVPKKMKASSNHNIGGGIKNALQRPQNIGVSGWA